MVKFKKIENGIGIVLGNIYNEIYVFDVSEISVLVDKICHFYANRKCILVEMENKL